MATAKRCLRDRLLRRYPGVAVEVRFNDHVADGHGTYKGWRISFESEDPNVLIGYKLAPLQCQFGTSRGEGEFAGVDWSTHGIIDQSERYGIGFNIQVDGDDRCPRALTKKMQAQVMRILKPFIRGTWKPQQTA